MDKSSVALLGANNQVGYFLIPLLCQGFAKVIGASRHQPAWSLPSQYESLTLDLDTDPFPHEDCATLVSLLPHRILLAALMAGQFPQAKRLILFSTSSIDIKSQSPLHQERDMAVALQQNEAAIVAYCQAHNIAYTVFRPTLIYGAGMDKNVSFIAKIMQRWHCFPLVGGGSGKRQPVHAEDLAIACMQALKSPQSADKYYYLSGAEILTYKDLVKRVAKAKGLCSWTPCISLGLLKGLLKIVNLLPKYRFINTAMLMRMQEDLTFCHAQAQKDFQFQPRAFDINSLFPKDEL